MKKYIQEGWTLYEAHKGGVYWRHGASLLSKVKTYYFMFDLSIGNQTQVGGAYISAGF